MRKTLLNTVKAMKIIGALVQLHLIKQLAFFHFVDDIKLMTYQQIRNKFTVMTDFLLYDFYDSESKFEFVYHIQYISLYINALIFKLDDMSNLIDHDHIHISVFLFFFFCLMNPALCYFINSSVIGYAINFRSTRMMIFLFIFLLELSFNFVMGVSFVFSFFICLSMKL